MIWLAVLHLPPVTSPIEAVRAHCCCGATPQMKRTIMVVILTLIFHSTAPAQGVGTTQDLYDRCIKDEVLCGSYLMGVASIMALMGKTYQDQTFEYKFIAPLSVFAMCSTGAPVTGVILRHVFTAWVDRHPESKPDHMASSAMDAFKEAWPCEKSN